VGFRRLVSDATYYGAIWDAAARPDVQNCGIGGKYYRNFFDVPALDDWLCSAFSLLVIIGNSMHTDIHAMAHFPEVILHKGE
jgi:hypothetical protein